VRLPVGVRDWLPEELVRKREIEAQIRQIFENQGYAEVETPSIELVETLAFGLGDRAESKTFRFEDRRGTALGLRPEMTTSIARLVATRMRERPLPMRLSYLARAFRYEEPQEGRMREFTQAGVELIGPGSAQADAEALLGAIAVLDAVGLSHALIDINHVAVVDGVLAKCGYIGAEAEALKTLFSRRDLVALEEKLADTDPAIAKTLLALTLSRGGHEFIAHLRSLCDTPAAVEGLTRLSYLLERAQAAGYGDRLCVDFTLLREHGYYTGLVFEGYVSTLGFPLCGGGRYDGLLPRFGLDTGAVGWATGVERLMLAQERCAISFDNPTRQEGVA
jgi:ATP phosphoribosyltransferase regulatory subunit